MFQFVGKLEEFEDSPLWRFHIKIPRDIGLALAKESKRLSCEFNSELESQLALLSSSKGFYFINLNLEARKKLNLNTGDEVQINIENDKSDYGTAVPEVFIELCQQDIKGSTVFHTLTIGRQRSLLHLMSKPKSEEKQLEKTLIIFDYLKSVNGKLDFKELNIAFKENTRFKKF